MNRFLLFLGICVCLGAQPPGGLTERERELLARIDKLEQRIAALEARGSGATPVTAAAVAPTDPQPAPAAAIAASDTPSLPGFLPGTTLNFNFDGYYGYNFNHPIDRANLLRANDTLSNNFTLNQVGMIVERAPDAAAGRRLGYRLDLMFGQNTETLQGSPQNEPRPQVYRHIFQAYGSYILPVGSGLTVDFGKFASALGFENNYAKDQLNYSRSYFFNFLPFYHMGFRSTYSFNDRFSVQHWLVNGANETEDFNGFKSNALLFTIKPARNVSWNVNYYFGQETRDPVNGQRAPNGREHIFDTYVQWNATRRVTLAAEADYVINRVLALSAPARVTGGVGYARVQITPRVAFAGRFEYLSDRGGLFSGITQALKEGTLTLTYQPRDGFQVRTEYRRDFSNRPFFLTDVPGRLDRSQDTATLGLLWWFGGKQGAW